MTEFDRFLKTALKSVIVTPSPDVYIEATDTVDFVSRNRATAMPQMPLKRARQVEIRYAI